MRAGESSGPERRAGSALADLLARREAFIEHLASRPVDKPTLIDALDVSRSTVDRAVRDLQLGGLVERRPDGYGLTLFGSLAWARYHQLTRDLAVIERTASALAALPASTSLDDAFFLEARVVTTADAAWPLETAMRTLLEDADRIRAVMREPHFELISLAQRRVVEDGLRLELVHATSSVERLAVHFDELVESALASGNVSLYRAETVPPFSLLKARRAGRETVLVVLYGETDADGLALLTDHPAATARFDERFADRVASATEVTLEDVA